MSNQTTKKQYAVTTPTFSHAYGGQWDVQLANHINEYAEANNMRLINVVCNERQFTFFWASK